MNGAARNAAALGLTLLGCAAAYGSPGTPSGGPFCLQSGQEPISCFESEQARAEVLRDRDAADRADSEQEATKRLAGQKAELETVLQARIDEQKREDDAHQAYLARAAEHDQVERAERGTKAARAAEVKRLASDPAVAGRAISGIICTIEDELVRLHDQLGREKRATKLGGVTNLTARDSVASEIVDDEGEIKGWKAALKRVGAPQTPCAEVTGVYACRLNPAQCTAADRDAGDVWRLESESLWATKGSKPQR